MVKKEANAIKQEVTETVSAVQPQSNSSANVLESKINALSSEKDKLIGDFLALKSENQRMHFDFKHKKRLEQKLSADLSFCKNENKSLVNDLNNCNIELEKVKADKTQIESKLKQQQATIEVLEQQQNQQKASYNDLKKQCDRLSKENKTTTARIKQIQSATAAAAVSANSNQNDYAVEKIIDHKKKYHKNYFLVRWDGFTSKDDTWEPENNLKHLSVYKKYIKGKSI